MNGPMGFISLSAFLLAVSGQFPTLSPSYSIEGIISITENGAAVSTSIYSGSVDISRGLGFVDETETTASGVVTNIIEISSLYDGAAYFSDNNMCNEITFESNVNFPIDTNVWDSYVNATESPAGTFTITKGDITLQVTIVNGVPDLFTTTTDTSLTTFAVKNFDNFTPDFSTFYLPSECSQFTCNACYSSAVSVSVSSMLLLTTLLVCLFTTL